MPFLGSENAHWRRLETIGYELDEGDFIGTYAIARSETIAPENVKAELLEVGSDESFFALLDTKDGA